MYVSSSKLEDRPRTAAFKHSSAGLDKFVFCLTPDCT